MVGFAQHILPNILRGISTAAHYWNITYARYSNTSANGGPSAHGCYVRSDFAQPFRKYDFCMKQSLSEKNIFKELRHL
jgi:hypothetical protein